MSTRLELRRKLFRIIGPWENAEGGMQRRDGFGNVVASIQPSGRGYIELPIDGTTCSEGKRMVDDLLGEAGYELEDQ